MDEINDYKEWNNALFHYFFKDSASDPILFINESVLQQVGETFHITKDPEETWEHHFLSRTLLSSTSVDLFRKGWKTETGNSAGQIANWGKLVEFLEDKKFNKKPAYFGMICAIMYLACKVGANHADIMKEASTYLGKNYKVGELIGELFLCLHHDIPSFNPYRMKCGTQINISRIKYHTVQKLNEREDFIDFLEINNLEWGYEPFEEYAKNKLIPSLLRANKLELVKFVTDTTNIPYIKNLLESGLQFGKKVTTHKNEVQKQDLKWRYEMYFDLDGVPSFYIVPLYNDNIGFRLDESGFSVDESLTASEYLGASVALRKIPAYEFSMNGRPYVLQNVASDADYEESLIFELVAPRIYHQVTETIPGNSYIKFIDKNSKKKTRLSKDLKRILEDSSIENYEAFEVESVQENTKSKSKKEVFTDTFGLFGLGSWFSICLQESQKLYWQPDTVGSTPMQITDLYGRNNGRTYFRLPKTGKDYIGGTLFAVSDANKYDLAEHIVHFFKWNGKDQSHFVNGWGEETDVRTEIEHINEPDSQFIIQLSKDSKPTKNGNMLLQILYDIADSDGCVAPEKLTAAIDFVLGFYSIKRTKQNTISVIYALRRLGFVSSFYIENKYVNQLVPAYLGKSNKSFGVGLQAYSVNGVYDGDRLMELLDHALDFKTIYCETKCIEFKRPYREDALVHNPEFICLPDLIKVAFPKGYSAWPICNYSNTDYMIMLMENMAGFEQYFGLNHGGDYYLTPEQFATPCVIKDSYNNDVLLTESGGNYYSHKIYTDEKDRISLIPRHLARVYCENKKNSPICIFKQDLNNNVDYGHIMFLNGMGVPELLEVALCDISGMPSYEKVFIVNSSDSHLPKSYSYTEGRIYETLATGKNNRFFSLQSALCKLAGNTDSKEFPLNRTFVYSPKSTSYYEMKLIEYSSYSKSLLLLRSDELIAFSSAKKVYVKEKDSYLEVKGSDINQKLSSVINNNYETLDTCFSGQIPEVNDERAQSIRIIK